MIVIQDGNIIKNVLSESVTPGFQHSRELDGLSSGGAIYLSVLFGWLPGWCDERQQ